MRPFACKTASSAWSILSTTKPVTPSSITSGVDPDRNATTGVPQAIASIMTRPKGSDQSMGNRRARALPRNSAFWRSLISPMNSTLSWAAILGAIALVQYAWSTLSILAAIFSGIPARRAMSIARSGRFSGEMRPRKAR